MKFLAGDPQMAAMLLPQRERLKKYAPEAILNEIIAAAQELRQRIAAGLRILYVLHNPQEIGDPTLQKALSAVPEAEIFYDSFTSAPTHRGYYGTYGYQVGTLALILKLADCMPNA